MKKSLLGAICLLFSLQLQAQLSHTALLDTIITLGKSQSTMRDSIDWPSMETAMQELYMRQPNDTGVIAATKHMLKALGDYHGRIWHKQIPHNGMYKKWIRSSITLDSLAFKDYQWCKLPTTSAMLEDRIGYIQVPGIGMSPNDSARAAEIRQTILTLDAQHKPKGWIIDLRFNGGGTMWPMLAGLSDLLGKGKVGSFYDPNSDAHEYWEVKDHDIWIEDWQGTDYQLKNLGKGRRALSRVPIVVLTSRLTSSSGEIVTLAFRNRPNTVLIGEPTAGYTTGVSWTPLGEGWVLQLAMNFYADRKGEVFKGTRIKPDISHEGDANRDNLEADTYIQRGVTWLKEQF